MPSRRCRIVADRLKLVAAALTLAVAAPAGAQGVDRWAGEIEEASIRFGVPQQWIRRVMAAESGGESISARRPIVSRAGAMGLMQLMPGTWSDMRALLGLGGDPNDPRDNILAGTAYLRLMYDRFGYPGLFAAYNAGPARYAAFLSGSRPLPSETRTYVAKVERSHARLPSIPGRPAPGLFAVTADAKAASAAASRPPQIGGTLFVQLPTAGQP